MLIVDRMIIAGIRWVLDKVVSAVDQELNDDTVLRQRLLEAQMRAELGEITSDELSEIETNVMARLREIQEARGGGAVGIDPNDSEMRVSGVEATFTADEDFGHSDDERR